ncbi:uncharacterized protein A1O5_01519 [Cladophialophora psammophila CBS 110553]|uniref:Uncharacterized protein n=1 Tax=Cladophialophora psammophila CBS 110553 TaxID=1182543 RepID=W9X3P7_9EURO|nr:uncharacterized protein A1O5_01519 [Cladophialophora psammophila CBS 110553]EXJ74823.1 hypothetical protein A1O5_01519 [Cladophialophora psammophila CBS 110553]
MFSQAFQLSSLRHLQDSTKRLSHQKETYELIDNHGKKDELATVVYAGHGLDPLRFKKEAAVGPSVWIAREDSASKKVVGWSTIQPSPYRAP